MCVCVCVCVCVTYDPLGQREEWPLPPGCHYNVPWGLETSEELKYLLVKNNQGRKRIRRKGSL